MMHRHHHHREHQSSLPTSSSSRAGHAARNHPGGNNNTSSSSSVGVPLGESNRGIPTGGRAIGLQARRGRGKDIMPSSSSSTSAAAGRKQQLMMAAGTPSSSSAAAGTAPSNSVSSLSISSRRTTPSVFSENQDENQHQVGTQVRMSKHDGTRPISLSCTYITGQSASSS